MRIGQGYDVHRFNEGDHIILGGVTIPYEKGLEAHSDGDVVLHALADALLGAAALGDIGKHFPDTDPEFKGADSRVLLRHVYGIVRDKGYRLVNADITIIAQAPKMAPHIAAMCGNIAEDLETEIDSINVKATTTEKLGFEGRKEGIAVQAVVLLE
ncbi:2-C-methyl-D-erythritol 2,4-cyclodiphosphate synthase [Methylomicrobium lacus]|uniref:2-C-methyl-D-erythritol 2,4-cyclodiphosphate synthase n=1 Tax=Methylomicrobium lacus TaxID=136992 RepID=UPI0035A9454C